MFTDTPTCGSTTRVSGGRIVLHPSRFSRAWPAGFAELAVGLRLRQDTVQRVKITRPRCTMGHAEAAHRGSVGSGSRKELAVETWPTEWEWAKRSLVLNGVRMRWQLTQLLLSVLLVVLGRFSTFVRAVESGRSPFLAPSS